MFTFYRDNGILYTETKFDLVRPFTFNGRKFEKSDESSFEDVELIEKLLLFNANVLIRKEPGAEFEKPNLYDFSLSLENKTYEIIDKLPTLEHSFTECKDLTSEITTPETMTELNNSFNDKDVEENDGDSNMDDKQNNQNNNHQGKNRKKRNNNSQQEDGDK